MSGSEDEAEFWKKKYEAVEIEQETVKGHNSALTEEVAKQRIKIRTLEHEIDVHQQELYEAKDNLDRKELKERDCATEISKLKKDLVNLEVENQSQVSKDEYCILKDENRRLKEVLKTIKDDKIYLENEMKNRDGSINSFQEQIENKARLLKKIKNEHQDELHVCKQFHEERYNKLASDLYSCQRSLNAREGDVSKLQEIIHEFEEERKARELREKAELEKPASPPRITLQQELQEMQIKDMQTALQDVRSENEAKANQLSNAETKILSLENDKIDLQKKLQLAKEEVAKLTESSANVSNENDENIQKLSRYESEKSTTNENTELNKQVNQNLSNKTDMLQQEVKDKVQLIEDLERKLSKSRQFADELLQNETKFVKENGEIKNQLCDEQKKIEELERKLSKSRQFADEVLQNETKTVKENGEIKNQLCNERMKILSLENDNIDLQNKLQLAKEEMAKLTEISANVSNENDENIQKILSLENDKIDLQKKLQLAKEEMAKLTESSANVSNENDENIQKLSEYKSEKSTTNENSERNKQVNQNLLNKTEMLQQEVKDKVQLIEDLERKLLKSRQFADKLLQNETKAAEENKEIKNQLCDEQKKVCSLEREKTDLRNKLRSTDQEMKKAMENATNFTDKYRENIEKEADLSRTNGDLLVKTEALQKEVEELKRNSLQQERKMLEEIQVKENELCDEKMKISELESSKKRMEMDLRLTNAVIKEMQNNTTNVTKEISVHIEEVRRVEKERDDFKMQLDVTKQELKRAYSLQEQQPSNSGNVLSELQSEKSNLLNKTEMLQKEVKDQVQLIEDLERKLSKSRQFADELLQNETKLVKENGEIKNQLCDEQKKSAMFMSTPIKPPTNPFMYTAEDRDVLFGDFDSDSVLEDSLSQGRAATASEATATSGGQTDTVMISAHTEFRATIPLLQAVRPFRMSSGRRIESATDRREAASWAYKKKLFYDGVEVLKTGDLLEPDPDYMLEEKYSVGKLNEFAQVLFRSAKELDVLGRENAEEEDNEPQQQFRPPSSQWGTWSEEELRRIADLQRRNSIQPPHLKSSYPVETQGKTPRRCGETVKRGRPADTLRRMTMISEEVKKGFDSVAGCSSPRKRLQAQSLYSTPAKISRAEDRAGSSSADMDSTKPQPEPSCFEIPNTPKVKKKGFIGRKAQKMMNNLKKSDLNKSGISSKFGSSRNSIASTRSGGSTISNPSSSQINKEKTAKKPTRKSSRFG